MANRKEPNEIRNRLVHIAFSEEEINKIDIFVEKALTTRTDFIRQAIFDKIRLIEHPELETGEQLSQAKLEEIEKNTRLMLELQQQYSEQAKIVNEINKSLSLLQEYSLQERVDSEKENVFNILEVHGELTPGEILEKIALPEEVLFKILADKKLFELTQRGKFRCRKQPK